MFNFTNEGKVTYKRTYARKTASGKTENWESTVDRVISGNNAIINISEEEINQLKHYMLNMKSTPAGRGLWFSGSDAQYRIGGAGLVNCWAITCDNIDNFIMAQDLLMLGGGVGASVEHKYVSKLPKVKKGVQIVLKNTKDADFIIPDSREGWNEMTRRVLESFFITGKSFSYSTVCIRGYGEEIKGFGGKASGPKPFEVFIEKASNILKLREGKHIRPIDAMDIICSIGEFVVSGNVRRSAIIILGDSWDKEYLTSKRWDLGIVPSHRAYANLSVVCDDVEDLHPLFWKTYENGEPFGLVNRKNIQKYGRMGEVKKDTAYLVNPCGEATLENGEPCNIADIFLPNLSSQREFIEASRLMFRYCKRVAQAKFHNEINQDVITKNQRIGIGITGCLQAPQFFNKQSLDEAYNAIQQENEKYSKELKVNESIRTTVVKPSGTVSLLGNCTPGIHPAYSRYYIRRIRIAANDPLIPILRKAGHQIEPVLNIDGSINSDTLVVNFYIQTPENTPCADEGFDTWRQLDTLLLAQKHWADQAVSVTVYYKKEDIDQIKAWLKLNLKYLKSISFLCHNDHGFKQAPYEAISEEVYKNNIKLLTPIDLNDLESGKDLENLECIGGVCPIK